MAVGGLALLVGGWLLGQVLVFDYLATPALSSSVASFTGPARPDSSLDVQLAGAGVGLDTVQLYRSDRANPNATAPETPVSVQPQAGHSGDWTLVAPDGGSLLRPDGDYRLVVSALEPRPAFPLPRTEVIEREYRFTTVQAPRPDLGADPIKPRWATPFTVSWNLPMASLDATVSPPVALRASVDPQDAHKTQFALGKEDGSDLTSGQTYQVTIGHARSVDGLDLQQAATFAVVTPMRPKLENVPDTVVLHKGDDLELKSSAELAEAKLEATNSVALDTSIDHNKIVIKLQDYSQGMDFDLIVASGTSTEGAPLPGSVDVHVTTPAALDPPVVRPGGGAVVSPTTHPTIIFAAPVADPDAALNAIDIQPSIKGEWRWTAPNRAELVPNSRLPVLTSYKVTIHGGPDGPRSQDGGYLEDDVVSTFQTTHDKRIDVSLAGQVVTLIQDGQAIRTLAAATGVAAAPTPPGDYVVQAHMAQARFVGQNPDGSHYDIPDVHWVMPFMGDYTIHGAYWRGRFGVPGSDGCVSMTDADAKVLYDWADVGTPVIIHA
ncbi:MAG: L,D-transpeptidase [Chloroflexi bacterium]|nr:L,D-transpeptidase [Chloroflexota bacterium]